MSRSFRMAALCAVALAASLQAQIPHTISYQGVLTDPAGTPVADGQKTLTFNLYTAATGGAASWTETQTVTTSRGVFSVLLGSKTPLALTFDRPLWLGVIVSGGTELTPRTALASVPTSIRAQTADTARAAESLNGFTASSLPLPGSILVLDGSGMVPVSAIPGVPVQIADGSVTTPKLADAAVVTPKLADASVTASKLAAGAVGADAIALPFILTNTAAWPQSRYVMLGDNKGGGGGVRGNAVDWIAVHGNSANYYGVAGYSLTKDGVIGQTGSGTAGNGIVGDNPLAKTRGYLATPIEGVKGTGPTGVYGESAGVSGQGVLGRGTGDLTEGVLGLSLHADGVSGISEGSGLWAGVHGASTNAVGMLAESVNNDGINGASASAARSGVFGNNSAAGGFGVYGANLAVSTGGYLGGEHGAWGARGDFQGWLGFSDGGVLGKDEGSGNYTYLGMSTRACMVSGAFYQSGGAFEVHPTSTVWTTNKPATVKLRDGSRVKLFAEESAEVLFSDYGAGRLTGGRTHVALDPVFAQTVTIDAAHPMRVFVQLEDECRGVYVTAKTAAGFDVVELQGGRSDASFSYRVVCTRKHYEGERLASEQTDAAFNTRMLEAVWPEVRAEKDAMDARVRDASARHADMQRTMVRAHQDAPPIRR